MSDKSSDVKDPCKCGLLRLDSFIGVHGMHDGVHSREWCYTDNDGNRLARLCGALPTVMRMDLRALVRDGASARLALAERVREACAKVCDVVKMNRSYVDDDADQCATAVRALDLSKIVGGE